VFYYSAWSRAFDVSPSTELAQASYLSVFAGLFSLIVLCMVACPCKGENTMGNCCGAKCVRIGALVLNMLSFVLAVWLLGRGEHRGVLWNLASDRCACSHCTFMGDPECKSAGECIVDSYTLDEANIGRCDEIDVSDGYGPHGECQASDSDDYGAYGFKYTCVPEELEAVYETSIIDAIKSNVNGQYPSTGGWALICGFLCTILAILLGILTLAKIAPVVEPGATSAKPCCGSCACCGNGCIDESNRITIDDVTDETEIGSSAGNAKESSFSGFDNGSSDDEI